MALTTATELAPRPIADAVAELGLAEGEWVPYGPYAAKVPLSVLDRPTPRRGSLVAVTGMTPTPYGEGKTTTAIGMAMALARSGRRATVTLRQGSLGPTFGIKGAALGGGAATVVPEELLALHFTGDFHAVTAAHNLLAAFVDAHLIHGNALGLDPLSITWPRVLDQNDASLRQIIVGLGGRRNGVPRETRFDITAASEVMAILALSRDLADLRRRCGAIVVGTSRGRAITAEDLGAAGSMAALLRDALLPNVVQTAEGTPAIVHTGPFANIAPGNSSILADEIALRLADVVITESGFGADCGFEKLMHLKSRASGASPSVAVIVATVRALKHHGGRPGSGEDVEAVRRGGANLAHHIGIVRAFGVRPVVALNRFADDTPAEIHAALAASEAAGAPAAVSEAFALGGEGAAALAEVVLEHLGGAAPRVLYADDAPAEEKIEALATTVYGASGVSYEPAAKRALARYADLGYGSLPVCVAKTPLSLSHDPKLVGRPRGFVLPVREVRLQAGAGYLVPVAGEISTMPGLPSRPIGIEIDLDPSGRIVGLR